tara:strand:- start:805 stop:1149 length:345 start_codon:yes stop_codon:yes gene_type:complete
MNEGENHLCDVSDDEGIKKISVLESMYDFKTHTYGVEVKMKLNTKHSLGNHVVNLSGKPVGPQNVVSEERPNLFVDLDGEDEATDLADLLIRQNQIVNRALRRQYRSRVARKAI